MSPKMRAYLRDMVVFPEVHFVRVYESPRMGRDGGKPVYVERFATKEAANAAADRLAEEWGAWVRRDCRRLFDSGNAYAWNDGLNRVVEINPC